MALSNLITHERISHQTSVQTVREELCKTLKSFNKSENGYISVLGTMMMYSDENQDGPCQYDVVNLVVSLVWKFHRNSFHSTGPFLYPSKTSENRMFSYVFKGYKKGPMVWNGLMKAYSQSIILRGAWGPSVSLGPPGKSGL